MGCNVNSLGHIGIQVSDMDRSLKFYREVVGLKLTGRWGPPDFPGQVCFMRVDQLHHNFVLFGLPEGTDSTPFGGDRYNQTQGCGPQPCGLSGGPAGGLARRPRSCALVRRRTRLGTLRSWARGPGRKRIYRRKRQPRLLLPRSGREPHRNLYMDDGRLEAERRRARPRSLESASFRFQE